MKKMIADMIHHSVDRVYGIIGRISRVHAGGYGVSSRHGAKTTTFMCAIIHTNSLRFWHLPLH